MAVGAVLASPGQGLWRVRCEMIFVLPLIAGWVPRCLRAWLEWFW